MDGRSLQEPGIGRRRLPPCRWPARAAIALLPLLIACLALAGCQEVRRQASDEALARAIAVVNNERIAFEDFENEVSLFLTRWDRLIKNDPEKKQAIKVALLERKIEQILLDQEARRKGIELDLAEKNARILDLVSSVDEKGGTVISARVRAEKADWQRQFHRRLIHQKLIQREVIGKIRPSTAELRAFYNRSRHLFRREERVNVRHIAVGSRSLYNQVTRLLNRRRNFGSLVQKYSITPDRMAEGELGYVKRGVLPKEFDRAIFKLKIVGEISSRREVVQTQMGYHIFRLEGRKPAGLLSFKNALPEIRRLVIQERQSAAYRDWINRLREKATIVIDHHLLTTE